MQHNEKVQTETAARQARTALICRFITESPYSKGLKPYREEIIRLAENHTQIVQNLDLLRELKNQHSTKLLPGMTPRISLKIINDFLEFVYFSTSEMYKRVSNGK